MNGNKKSINQPRIINACSLLYDFFFSLSKVLFTAFVRLKNAAANKKLLLYNSRSGMQRQTYIHINLFNFVTLFISNAHEICFIETIHSFGSNGIKYLKICAKKTLFLWNHLMMNKFWASRPYAIVCGTIITVIITILFKLWTYISIFFSSILDGSAKIMNLIIYIVIPYMEKVHNRSIGSYNVCVLWIIDLWLFLCVAIVKNTHFVHFSRCCCTIDNRSSWIGEKNCLSEVSSCIMSVQFVRTFVVLDAACYSLLLIGMWPNDIECN